MAVTEERARDKNIVLAAIGFLNFKSYNKITANSFNHYNLSDLK